MLDKEKADACWASLSVEEQRYLINKYALTGNETRAMLGVLSVRFTNLIKSGKIHYVKRDTSAMIFLRSDVEKRVEEAKALRKKHILKIHE